MRLATLTLAVTLFGARPGWAETYMPIPRYDVDKGCADADTPEGVKGCIKLEQDSYDYVKSVWFRVPEIIRKMAIKFADDQPQSKSAPKSFYYLNLSMSLKYDIAHPPADALPDHFQP